MTMHLDATAKRGVCAGVLVGAIGPAGQLILGLLTQSGILVIGYWNAVSCLALVGLAMVPTTIAATLVVGWSVRTHGWRDWMRIVALGFLIAFAAWIATGVTIKTLPLEI
jgi:hypothetical protein